MCGGSRTESIIAVSSVAFNMAGSVENRRKFIPTETIGAVIGGHSSIPEFVQNNIMRGPAIRAKSFSRWSRNSDYHTLIGVPEGRLTVSSAIDNFILAEEIKKDIGKPINVIRALIEPDDVTYWVTKWVTNNAPEYLGTEYSFFHDSAAQTATITWPDLAPPTTISVPVIDVDKMFIRVLYITAETFVTTGDPIEVGDMVEVDTELDLPSVVGWTHHSTDTEEINQELKTITTIKKEYSNGDPDDISTNTETVYEDFDLHTDIYITGGYYPDGVDATNPEIIKYNFKGVNRTIIKTQIVKTLIETEIEEETVGSLTTITTTTVETDYLEDFFTYQDDEYYLVPKTWGPYKLWEYGAETGNEILDEMFKPAKSVGVFTPFIPIRVDGKFLSTVWSEEELSLLNTATRRAFHNRYKKLEGDLAENEGIEDIDYAYVTFGTALSSKFNDSKRYLYEFFLEMFNQNTMDNPYTFSLWAEEWEKAHDSQVALQAYYDNNTTLMVYPIDEFTEEVRLDYRATGTPPATVPYPPMPQIQLGIQSSNRTILNYSMQYDWVFAGMDSGTGEGFPGAKNKQVSVKVLEGPPEYTPFYAVSKVDQYLIDNQIDDPDPYQYGGAGIITPGIDDTIKNPFAAANAGLIDRWGGVSKDFASNLTLEIIFQDTEDSWKKILIYDLVLMNKVYHGEYNKGEPTVRIDLSNVMGASAEDEIIIPLNEDILQRLGLKYSTEIANEAFYVIANCYTLEKVTVKSGGFIGILVTVAVIVVTVILTIINPPAGSMFAAMATSAMATGTALGFTGVAAAIVGAVANAVIAMVVTQIIMMASTAILGDKIGALVGAIVSVIALNAVFTSMSGKAWTWGMDNLITADGLLKMTSAVGEGLSGYARAGSMDIIKDMQSLQLEQTAMKAEYIAKADDVLSRYQEEIGFNAAAFNPLKLTDTFTDMPDPTESRQMFLNRTLMTGSDIAAVTHGIISNYVDANLDLKLDTTF